LVIFIVSVIGVFIVLILIATEIDKLCKSINTLPLILKQLEEINKTTHNKDCAVTVDKQPSLKSADADFAQS
jgi:hypothetical protein